MTSVPCYRGMQLVIIHGMEGVLSLVLQQFSGFWVGAGIIFPAVMGSSIFWFQGEFHSVGWFLTSVTWLYGITAASNSWNGGTWSLVLQQFSSFSIGAAMIFSAIKGPQFFLVSGEVFTVLFSWFSEHIVG